MVQNKQLDFRNQKFFIGIDVHLKNWKVTIRHNQLELRTFSMHPSPDELSRYSATRCRIIDCLGKNNCSLTKPDMFLSVP